MILAKWKMCSTAYILAFLSGKFINCLWFVKVRIAISDKPKEGQL